MFFSYLKKVLSEKFTGLTFNITLNVFDQVYYPDKTGTDQTFSSKLDMIFSLGYCAILNQCQLGIIDYDFKAIIKSSSLVLFL